MTRRILTTILAVTTLAVTLFGVPLALGIRRLYDNEAVAAWNAKPLGLDP